MRAGQVILADTIGIVRNLLMLRGLAYSRDRESALSLDRNLKVQLLMWSTLLRSTGG